MAEPYLQAKSNLSILRQKVQQKRSQLMDTDVSSYARRNGVQSVKLQQNDPACCRTLRGHTGKVYALDWAPGKEQVLSVSQDGHAIVWNALTGQKMHALNLICSWMLTCAFSPSGKLIACGGLDCVASIYTLNSQKTGVTYESKVLRGHKGYVSCCKFVPNSDNQIITTSADGTCVLWDIESGQKIIGFGGNSASGHLKDVLCVSISTENPQLFVSGSCDCTVRLWDVRTNKSVQTFRGHDEDVNAVQFLSDGMTFSTGSDDCTCRMFDTRTGHHLQIYKDQSLSMQKATARALAFSYSGRLLFTAYSNGDCYIWDSLTAEVVRKMKDLPEYHTQFVSCLGLASDGSALCTGSWDQTLKIWSCRGTVVQTSA